MVLENEPRTHTTRRLRQQVPTYPQKLQLRQVTHGDPVGNDKGNHHTPTQLLRLSLFKMKKTLQTTTQPQEQKFSATQQINAIAVAVGRQLGGPCRQRQDLLLQHNAAPVLWTLRKNNANLFF
jgi:hypothetical protein